MVLLFHGSMQKTPKNNLEEFLVVLDVPYRAERNWEWTVVAFAWCKVSGDKGAHFPLLAGVNGCTVLALLPVVDE